jgi:hypothetical protein
LNISKSTWNPKKPRICGPEDIGEKLYNTGTLYICPPADGIEMMQSVMTHPHSEMKFYIKPAKGADDKFINTVTLKRYQMDPIVEYDIHGSRPILNVPVFLNNYRLNVRQTQKIYTEY